MEKKGDDLVRKIWREYNRLLRLAFPDYVKRQAANSAKWRKTKIGRARIRARRKTQHYLAYRKKWLQTPEGKAYDNARKEWRRATKAKSKKDERKSIAIIYRRCATLRQWFDVVVDHIIPLSRGGSHTPRNLQIIYRFENEIKGARLGYKPQVVFQ